MRMKSKHQVSRDKGLLGLLEKKKGRNRASENIARVLYPAKVAAGPCTRFTRYGGLRFPDAGLPSGRLFL
jgi:hypothetical protein